MKWTAEQVAVFGSAGNLKVKEEAAMTLATVHQSKGMEDDSVVVWHEFQDQTSSPPTEEINILYVAVTRARSFPFIPDAVFSATPHEWADRPRIFTP